MKLLKTIFNYFASTPRTDYSGCKCIEIMRALSSRYGYGENDVRSLVKVDLSNMDLRGADISTRLTWTNLENSNCHSADFGYSDMLWTKLDGTCLLGANLKTVKNLTAEQLVNSQVDTTTKLPEHITLDEIINLRNEVKESANPDQCSQQSSAEIIFLHQK